MPMIRQNNMLPNPGEMVLKSEKDIPDHIWVASEYLKRGKFENVVLVCQEILKMKKDNVEAQSALAAAYVGLGNEEKAQELVEALSQSPSAALPAFLARAYLYLHNFQQAEEQYIKAITLSDDSVEYRLELGNFYLDRGRLEDASLQFLSVLKQKDISMAHFVNANFEICKIDMQKEHYGKVVKRAKMMIDLYPPVEQGYNFLAYAYIGNGTPEKSINVYMLLKKNNPASPTPFQEMALIYLDKLNDPAKALQIAREGVEKFPDSAKSQDVLGWVLYTLNKEQESVQTFEKALQLAPDHPFYLYHLGLALQQKGDLNKAKVIFKKAQEKIDREKQQELFNELARKISECS